MELLIWYVFNWVWCVLWLLISLVLVQIAGIAYFSPAVAALFVSFYIIPPLDACTYIALDSGAKPVSVSSSLAYVLPLILP